MRARFTPPMPTSETELRSAAFLTLLTRAGTADAYDRDADDRDLHYWVTQEGQGLIDRGIQLNWNGQGALGGLMYFWERRIGWQATGPDAALYGPFAVDGNHPTPNTGPVDGWTTPFYDVGEVVPPGGGTVEPPPPPPPPVPDDKAILLAMAENTATILRGQVEQTDRVIQKLTQIGLQLIGVLQSGNLQDLIGGLMSGPGASGRGPDATPAPPSFPKKRKDPK